MNEEKNMPRPVVPTIFTECETYRGFVIAIYNSYYRGFGLDGQTRACDSRAEVRKLIDERLGA